jgi:hypothetical protein
LTQHCSGKGSPADRPPGRPARITSAQPDNSDNLLLVHLDPAHAHALIVSIPRDTIVYEPGCTARPTIGTGIWGPYQAAIIDGAMNIGGYGSATFVQSRNAGSSICSGLPASNPNSGSPP